MSDGVELNKGSGGAVILTDELLDGPHSGQHVQGVKLVLGADGVDGGFVSADNSLPVSAAALPLPAGAATEAKQDIGNASLASILSAMANLATQTTLASVLSALQGTLTVALPANAATASGQSIIIDLLAAIANKFNPVNLESGRVPIEHLASTAHSISVAHITGQMSDQGGAIVTPKFASINVSSSGDNTLVAAVASKKIRVISMMLIAAGEVGVQLQSGTGGTGLCGTLPLVANTGFVLPFNPAGWCETATNTLLNLHLDADVAVTGMLTYVEAS